MATEERHRPCDSLPLTTVSSDLIVFLFNSRYQLFSDSAAINKGFCVGKSKDTFKKC